MHQRAFRDRRHFPPHVLEVKCRDSFFAPVFRRGDSRQIAVDFISPDFARLRPLLIDQAGDDVQAILDHKSACSQISVWADLARATSGFPQGPHRAGETGRRILYGFNLRVCVQSHVA